MVLFSDWFRIQRIIKKCPGCYSAAGSGFNVLLKSIQGILQRLVQDLAYYSGYYSKYDQRIVQRLVRIQGVIKNVHGIFSASGSVFSVLLNNVQGIIQRLVQDSAYY